MSRRKALGGPLPARRRRSSPLEIPAAQRLRGPVAGDGRGPRDFDDDGLRAYSFDVAARQEHRPAHRPHRARREPHLRHGGAVPPDRHLQPGRPALPAAGRRSVDVLPRGFEGADPCRRASTSPARWPPSSLRERRIRRRTRPMIPFYVYYSMFGFQRVGDLAWAAGDMRARGFLIGGTSGRTTLNGEGLQHEDGHSHILASTIPNCVGYDPTYGYEVAVIVQNGLKRMYGDNEDVYYLHHHAQRELSPPRDARGRRGGHSQGHVQAEDRRGRDVRAQGSVAWRWRDPARGRGRGGACSRKRFRRDLRNLERDQLHRTAPRGAGGGTLEPVASRRPRSGCLMSSNVWPRARGQ